ncbi:non-homologous end-joining DNA ligase [Mucilaginibacter aquariorum]|uniref:Non-homologous end-joining DNA ligase n=1 Tax=Mucilaginibacter aquariorum TaxID=2967225 RepID=A0ABT1T2B6_9SPHI|nr:non-homologous end-joining DNA ligase [Mucilaginibacter aquariorum]MCQ6958756.1 non-homologous end-joining DNA ligase [Mucilaginibacter aquariorum]
MLLTSLNDRQAIRMNGHLLELTHLQKRYWPIDAVTKRDMLNYYHAVAPFLLPHLIDRPVALHRFPGGIDGAHFFQKDVGGIVPQWATTYTHQTATGEVQHYLVPNDEASLLWMTAFGSLEINPWLSRCVSADQPDYCVIDLDPGHSGFDRVIQAALAVKNVLDGLLFPGYPKTSGASGIHIYIPLGAKYTYQQSSRLAKYIATEVHSQTPNYTTLERSLDKRKGKLYIDHLQNHAGATIAAPYSLRPCRGATVSMPLHWDELKAGLLPDLFTIKNAADRLRETGDLFRGVLGKGVRLPDIILFKLDRPNI